MKKSAKNKEWSFLPMARTVKKVQQGLLEFGLSMGQFFVNTVNSFSKANALSEMLHSNEHDFSSIQEYLNEHPITAFELLSLIFIERAKGESELEKQLKSKKGEDNSKKKLDKDPKQIWKLQTVKPEWDRWQDTSGLYKSKADFARAMLALESCQLLNDDSFRAVETISDWCRNWETGNGKSRSAYEVRKEERDMVLQLHEDIEKK